MSKNAAEGLCLSSEIIEHSETLLSRKSIGRGLVKGEQARLCAVHDVPAEAIQIPEESILQSVTASTLV